MQTATNRIITRLIGRLSKIRERKEIVYPLHGTMPMNGLILHAPSKTVKSVYKCLIESLHFHHWLATNNNFT